MELKYKNWDDITVDVFQQLKNIQMINTGDVVLDEINNNIPFLAVLCECSEDDIANLTPSEFSKLLSETEFLKNPPQKNISNSYIINGKKYNVFFEIKDMVMSQYIDFQTFSKDQEKYYKQILACFLIPEGKKYCDGYNISDVIKDIGKMSIIDANGLLFFFTLSFQSLTKAMLTYSIRQMKKEMRKEKNKVRKITIGRAIIQMKEALILIENGGGLII